MFNDHVESAFTLANYSSYYDSLSSTSALIANIYLAFTFARHSTKCFTWIIIFNSHIRRMYFYSVLEIWRDLGTYPVLQMLINIREREVSQSCLTLCDPMDCSLPGSSVHEIFQAIVLEWIAISFSKGSSQLRDWTRVSCIVDRCFTVWATREVQINIQLHSNLDLYECGAYE